jgi:hypothetical protein
MSAAKIAGENLQVKTMKTTTIGILKPDGTHELKTVPVNGGSCYPALSEAVGGYIETVNLPYFKGQVYCNEEFLYKPDLPFNAWSDRIGFPNLHGNLVVTFSGRAVTEADIQKLKEPTSAQLQKMREMWARTPKPGIYFLD